MYDHFEGEVADSTPARIVLRVAGIGYELKVPTSTSARLRAGESARLFTILHVVDGQPTLLGFHTRAERELARRLLGVNGVGPSMCLMILSTMSPQQVGRAVLDGDAAQLKRVKGVGAKTAERLCLELRDIVQKLGFAEAAGDGGTGSVGAEVVLEPRARRDAISGLLTLGYTEKEARKKVEAIAKDAPEAETEEIIRRVLQTS